MNIYFPAKSTALKLPRSSSASHVCESLEKRGTLFERRSHNIYFPLNSQCVDCSQKVRPGESRPRSQTQRIEAEVHDNVTLQCDLDSRVNIENNTIVCDRVDLNKKVHAYRGKQDHPHEQMDQYRGRTTLNREDLSRGVLTLLISSVQTSDSGPYRCFVPKRKSSCTFNLTVVRGDQQNKTKKDTPGTTRPPLEEVTKLDVSDGAHMKAVRAGIITTAVIALCVLVVVLVVKRRTIQTCKKKLEGMWSQEVEKTPTDCEMKNLKTTERDEDPPNPAHNGLNDQNRNQNKTLV